MKLFRFGAPGEEKPGVVLDGATAEQGLDVSEFGEDFGEDFFGGDGIKRLRSWLERQAATHLGRAVAPGMDPRFGLPLVSLADARLGPVVQRPSKIIGIGMNYRAHVEETGGREPPEPKLFMKASTALSGAYDDLHLPPGSTQTDHEVELAFVMGRRASRVKRADAIEYVAGYTVCNDYSEREWQRERGGQFVKGKSADGFCPLGPLLVIDGFDASDSHLWLRVNGELRQDARTSDMIFSVAEIVACVSQYMTLLPGDVITTGTPSGVGLGRNPPRYLAPGDLVEYGIDGIGVARQRVCGPS